MRIPRRGGFEFLLKRQLRLAVMLLEGHSHERLGTGWIAVSVVWR